MTLETNPIRVGIVDDHEIFRKVIQVVLEGQRGISVVAEAENGLRAIEMVEQHRPDVVLMDINMPFMNGVTATQIIKSQFPETCIIVLSTHTDDCTRLHSLEAGASHCLSKAFNPSGLINVIRNSFLEPTQASSP